jgi:hypothetical protein
VLCSLEAFISTQLLPFSVNLASSVIMPVLDPRRTTVYHSYSYGAGAGLSGGAIAAIIIGAMLLIFIGAYISQYSKGVYRAVPQLRTRHENPIPLS